MAKYELEVVKEIKNEYTFSNESFLQDLFKVAVTEFEKQQVNYQIGSKWIRVFDSLNKLVLLEAVMFNKKEFMDYCKTKGIGFKKKSNPL
jgi:hypothetical protein